MTVNTTISSAGPYPGDGVTTRFPFDFPVLGANQLEVVRILADHSREVLRQELDYQVILNSDPHVNPGGVVDCNPESGPLGSDEFLWIERRVELLQPLDLPPDSAYPPQQIESALDRLTFMLQQQQQALDATRATRIAVLGSSEVVFPWHQTWVDHINGACEAEGLALVFQHTGAGALTHQLAMHKIDPLTDRSYVQFTREATPDAIIIELGINDAILGLGGRTRAQMIQDARDLYGYIHTYNPGVPLIYSRLVPYDEERHAGVPISQVKKKYCVPYMHQLSTQPGESDLVTSEPAELNKPLSPLMQTRLSDWKALDAECRGLADFVIDTNYFRPARLGLLSHDRYHPNAWGHYFIMSRVWEALQTDRELREALPVLKQIRRLGDFTDFDRLWHSAIKLDAERDGYEVDTDFLSGWEYPMWLNVLGDTHLIDNITFWANEQRPGIALNDVVNKSRDDLFQVMMTRLWPTREIATKLWRATASEPATWNQDVPPVKVSSSGAHIGSVQNSALPNGSWLIKYRVGRDVFGPFPIEVTGSYPRRARVVDVVSLVRQQDLELTGQGWQDISFPQVASLREIDDAPDGVISTPEGWIRIPPDLGYTRFRLNGFCTATASLPGRYRLGFYRDPEGYQHARGSADTCEKFTQESEPLSLVLQSAWLPIREGGEILRLTLESPGGVMLESATGVGLQVELG
ncbi:MAG: hypothetical protein ABW076_05290 [Candidatus Thiodiazotropha sp.]